MIERRLVDLNGRTIAIVEPTDEGLPMLTILDYDGEQAQIAVAVGVEALSRLGNCLLLACAEIEIETPGEVRDMLQDLRRGD